MRGIQPDGMSAEKADAAAVADAEGADFRRGRGWSDAGAGTNTGTEKMRHECKYGGKQA